MTLLSMGAWFLGHLHVRHYSVTFLITQCMHRLTSFIVIDTHLIGCGLIGERNIKNDTLCKHFQTYKQHSETHAGTTSLFIHRST